MRVKVRDQDITGEVVRIDGSKLVVLDDDRADWMEEDDDGTLVFRIDQLVNEEDVYKFCCVRSVSDMVRHGWLWFGDGCNGSLPLGDETRRLTHAIRRHVVTRSRQQHRRQLLISLKDARAAGARLETVRAAHKWGT